MTHREHSRLARQLSLLAVACFAVVFAGGSSCLDEVDPEPKECTARCDVEAGCGLRSEEDCKAAACNEDGTPKDQAADDCLATADDGVDCLTIAACACDASCARIDECLEGEPDPTCVTTCDTLVEQETTATYLENRCIIESKDCSDVPACGSSG